MLIAVDFGQRHFLLVILGLVDFYTMAIQKISIQDFMELAKTSPVLDVRSPGEYHHAHIPGAYSLPLFTDEERKVVGTAYKQQSRQTAIKIGLDYFGVKMKTMVEEAEDIVARFPLSGKSSAVPPEFIPMPIGRGRGGILVHCWRGGMRSAGVAWLLDLYGFKVYTLAGGYKAYRKWVRDQFETPFSLKVLGGYTGSGKTLVLHQLQKAGLPIIDLEKMGNHKGSAFGAMGESPQPTQEMFENLLAEALVVHRWAMAGETADSMNDQQTSINGSVWIEDESQRIGNVKIPDSFWKQMRSSKIVFIDIPFEERLNYLTEEYGRFETEKLVNAIIRIQKRLGGLETKNAVNYLIEKLEFVINNNFERITYTEAIDILKESNHNKKKKFQYLIEGWGMDLQSEHERYLVEKHFKKPVILTNYPAAIKSFYMRLDDNCEPGRQTVSAMDILAPGIGEIVGGSQREERLDKLEQKMKDMHIPAEELYWYLDTRRFGSCPHAGFGLGFERMVQFVTGMGNIRDVIPFPRYPKSAEF